MVVAERPPDRHHGRTEVDDQAPHMRRTGRVPEPVNLLDPREEVRKWCSI